MIAKITQKLDKPVESPKILGPIKLPSNCCKNSIKIAKYTKFKGCVISTTNIKMEQGIAPKKGPKNGITLVTPITTLTSAAYGNCNRDVPQKHKQPIIIESITLPMIKPIKVL